MDFIPSDSDTFEEAVKGTDGGEYRDRIRQYISRLSNQQVNMLNLLIDGYKPNEIQRILGMSPKGYGKPVHNEKLRKCEDIILEEGITMKIRKQTFSLDQYLKQMKVETIRTDQECQRMSGQWSANMVNELIFTVLTDNYIPPIILGEEIMGEIVKEYIIDGLQRSSSLFLFRYGNTKVTKSLDEHMVRYQRKAVDDNGNPKRDEKGDCL